MAGSDYNQIAARGFRRARDEARLNQAEFAAAVSDAMGLKGRRRLRQSTLSGWELGTRQVPAGALIAAATVAGISVSTALGEGSSDLAERLAKLEAMVRGGQPGPVAQALARGVRRTVKRVG
ncbi:MAG TPA: helix-turn-helix transcriptional regulator [Candidatus Dormibacteraeota bacterium]